MWLRWRVPLSVVAGPVVTATVVAACTTAPAPAPPPTTAPTPTAAAPTPTAAAPAGFVALADVDPTIVEEIRYHGAHNVVGRPIAGYDLPRCLLTREAAEALRRAQAAARARGYGLKVYDCHRPQRAVDDIARWARQPDDQRTKAEFYPRVAKSRLFAEGYLANPSAHTRGGTVDLTLVTLPPTPQLSYRPGEPATSCVAGVGRRFADDSVDMGTGFDCFDPLSATDAAGVSGVARRNRALLRQIMTDAGFVNYEREWWHYTLAR